ncbi:hypothetical protein B0H34DRAFT_811407, partial [Crassisporium funariophilum]
MTRPLLCVEEMRRWRHRQHNIPPSRTGHPTRRLLAVRGGRTPNASSAMYVSWTSPAGPTWAIISKLSTDRPRTVGSSAMLVFCALFRHIIQTSNAISNLNIKILLRIWIRLSGHVHKSLVVYLNIKMWFTVWIRLARHVDESLVVGPGKNNSLLTLRAHLAPHTLHTSSTFMGAFLMSWISLAMYLYYLVFLLSVFPPICVLRLVHIFLLLCICYKRIP